MNDIVRFGFFIALSLASNPALAADPKLDAQVQLGSAFSKCDDKDAFGYLEQRDFAFSVDPTLKTWGGTISRSQKQYSVPATVARCDKEMTPIAAKAKRMEELRPVVRALQDACWVGAVDDAAMAKYKAARATYVAKLGAEDPDGLRAKCDADVAKSYAAEKKREAERGAAEAKKKAEEEAARLAREKRDAIVTRINASIGGDRKKILETWHWPVAAIDNEERYRNAPVWSYTRDVEVGSLEGERGSLTAYATCTTSFHFSGDKLVKTTKSGRGCK